MLQFLFCQLSRSGLIALLCALALTSKSSPAQTISLASTSVGTLASENGLDFSAWLPRSLHNSLQADPKTLIAFTRPWLVSSRIFELASAPLPPRTTRTLPKPRTYPLEPDPFDWSLTASSPDEDDFAYLPDVVRPGHQNTAERLGELSEAHRPAHLAAKYDVALIGEREIGQGLNFFSVEKEMALGRELATEVEQSARLVTDPAINEYVNRTGQTLVQHSDCKVPFTIKVIDDDEVNAFALPGGFFCVNSGVILAADDEAEFAGVMAHEIAHVCARHATRNLTKSEIAQYASLPLIFFGGPVGYAIRQVSSIAMPLSFLKFSRDAEREADMLGMEYQYAAGYDPTAFVDFFEKLEEEGKESHNFVARAFMTHPMTDDRVRRAEATLEMLPDRENYITDTSDFDEIRDRVSRLMHGHGVKGGQRPHPTLRKRNGTR